ncbi:hypothetical protein N7539_001487 [Penicillium diatomitis]|uniref:Non-homologous end-joining factor 1 n=1 Tax=Penicillium diatomitis TaxID=2819901 RepID=A0A9W9XGU6_9EURO|nr:uncharacterized protein N7539_001487 [Penicillium diatomitis]KAJ5492741.1 hypothetical protein N7539_001487 [Penicillium diatomitis]
MASHWYTLALSGEKLPPLFYRYIWSRQGYNLHVTDLTYIWSEPLSRKEIISRAEETATTIDPSEDLGQFDLLLQKIDNGLRGENGTLVLGGSTSEGQLHLETTTNLPPPLSPLRWDMYLQKEDASSMTTHVIFPLLRSEAFWESRQQSLLQQLRQKDWVLAKLFDRFEALGADLTTVFPGVAGLRASRKGHSRLEAAKYIKGVAAFDEEQWLADSETTQNFNGISHLFRELATSTDDQGLGNLHPSQKEWWNHLAKSAKPVPTPENPEDSSSSQPQQQHRQSQTDIDLDGETASESEGDEFEQQDVIPRQQTITEKGTKSSYQATKHADGTAAPAQPEGQKDDLTETASESEREPSLSPPSRREKTPRALSPPPPKETKASPRASEPLTKPKKGLGVIGGRKKTSPSKPQTEPQLATPPVTEPSKPGIQQDRGEDVSNVPKGKKTSRLGMIGSKLRTKPPPSPEKPSKQRDSQTASTEKEQHVPSKPASPIADKVSSTKATAGPSTPTKEITESPKEETDDQKAARRREELKRQLEAKSKAPAKKSRKF